MNSLEAIDLNKLRYFYLAVKFQSFSKAAAELEITQSAVSQAISALESSLGRALLHRQKRTFRLTPYGRRLYGHCREIFSLAQEMTIDMNREKEVINLGVDEYCLLNLYPKLQTKRKIHLQCEQRERLEELVLEGVLDVAFFYALDACKEKKSAMKEIDLKWEKLAILSPSPSSSQTTYVPYSLHSFGKELPDSYSPCYIKGTLVGPLNLARQCDAKALAPLSLAHHFAMDIEQELDEARLCLKALHYGEKAAKSLRDLLTVV